METFDYIFGHRSAWFFLAWYLIAIFGLFLSKAIAYSGRGNTTPFSWKYFWKDNKWDLIIWFLGTFAIGRFHQDLTGIFFKNIQVQEMFIAFGWGFLNSTILQFIRKTDFGAMLKLPEKSDGSERLTTKLAADEGIRPDKPPYGYLIEEADIYFEKEEFEKSIELYKEALQFEPDLYYATEQIEKAEVALGIRPDKPPYGK